MNISLQTKANLGLFSNFHHFLPEYIVAQNFKFKYFDFDFDFESDQWDGWGVVSYFICLFFYRVL